MLVPKLQSLRPTYKKTHPGFTEYLIT